MKALLKVSEIWYMERGKVMFYVESTVPNQCVLIACHIFT